MQRDNGERQGAKPHSLRMQELPELELTFEFARSSGPGGQNVNKVNSKAVLRWNLVASTWIHPEVKARFLERFGSRLTKAGEVLLTSDRFRDQARNVEDCREKLRELLAAVARPPKKRRPTKPTRGSQIRRREEKRRQGQKKQGRSGRGWD
jgi:ribosome-associated protein